MNWIYKNTIRYYILTAYAVCILISIVKGYEYV